jgi:hypothetical protein
MACIYTGNGLNDKTRSRLSDSCIRVGNSLPNDSHLESRKGSVLYRINPPIFKYEQLNALSPK